jgi:hypothetical protein
MIPHASSGRLNWIRNGRTKCDGLNEDSFEESIANEHHRLCLRQRLA